MHVYKLLRIEEIMTEKVFLRDMHVAFAKTIDKDKETLRCRTCFRLLPLKVCSGRWVLLIFLTKLMIITAIVEFVMNYMIPKSGGFGGNIGHDPHLMRTAHDLCSCAVRCAGKADVVTNRKIRI